MTVRMIRAKVKTENTAELDQTVKDMFSAIEAAEPEGVRYASCKLPDGETYVILLELDNDELNPLGSLPEFRSFQENLPAWLAEPPAVDQLTPLGSYRLF